MDNYEFLSKALITIEDIKREVSNESYIFCLMKRLTAKNVVKKIKGGLYARINPLTKDIFANRYEIATALYSDATVGYHTALEFHGLANQIYSDVHIISSKKYSPKEIDDLDYFCFYSNYKEGILTIEQNATIRVTELERTVIDCIDRMDTAGGIEEVFMAISAITYCDEDKLLKHLHNYNKKFLYKKAGYLFSILSPKYLSEDFYKECKNNISFRDDDIREHKVLPGKYIKEWKLHVPEEIINVEH